MTEDNTKKRRRGNISCEFCRLRKTRCDGSKPSCTTCLIKNVVCSYDETRLTKTDQILSGIQSALRNMDVKLDQLVSTQLGSEVHGQHGKTDEGFEWIQFPSVHDLLDSLENGLDGILLVDIFQSQNLWTDDTPDLLLREETKSIKSNITSSPKLVNSKIVQPDPEEYKRLKEAYFDHIYIQFPLISEKDLHKCETYLEKEGYTTSSFQLATILLVCSLGSLVDSDGDDYWSTLGYQKISYTLNEQELPPGFQYFIGALEVRSRLDNFHIASIDNALLSTLASYYWLKTGNLPEFGDELSKSHKELSLVISRNLRTKFDALKHEQTEKCKELFWVNLNFERDFLKAVGRTTESSFIQPSNLVKLQKDIGIPSSYLPQISEDSEHTVSFKDDRNVYSFCTMTLSLLANLEKKLYHIFEYNRLESVDALLDIATKLKTDLSSWSKSLPIWEHIKDDKNVIIVNLKFALVAQYIDFTLLEKINNKNTPLLPTTLDQFNRIADSLIKSTSYSLKSFLKLSLVDRTPFLCLDILDIILRVVDKAKSYEVVPLDISFADLELMIEVIESIHPFTLHSTLIHAKSESILKILITKIQST